MLHLDIITIFPEYFQSVLTTSILGKALAEKKATVALRDLRPYGSGKHQLTDDRPFGGGAGMVMLVEPIDRALTDLNYRQGTPGEKILLTSAKGGLFNQASAKELATLQRLCLICGHYKGVDERVARYLADGEIRIGDYVLTGGEPAAAVIIDALVRLQPEVLGNAASLQGESHETPGVLAYPQYSRPADYKGWKVPEILLGGDHAAIEAYRQSQRQKV
jgi:tRNA (guanine37-N1)-methyltransferase